MSHSLKKFNILLVDDEADILDLFETYFQDWEIAKNITKAVDGLDATQKFSKLNFDLIISDLEMPKRTGTDFLEEVVRLKNFPPEKAIVLSGELNAERVQKIHKIGIKNILTKPCFEEKLKAIVYQVLELR
jgi:CheY-like chemotaxis protein